MIRCKHSTAGMTTINIPGKNAVISRLHVRLLSSLLLVNMVCDQIWRAFWAAHSSAQLFPRNHSNTHSIQTTLYKTFILTGIKVSHGVQ